MLVLALTCDVLESYLEGSILYLDWIFYPMFDTSVLKRILSVLSLLYRHADCWVVEIRDFAVLYTVKEDSAN